MKYPIPMRALILTSALLFASTSAFGAPAAAAAPRTSAKPWLKKKVEEAKRIATQDVPKAKQEAVWNEHAKDLLQEMIDWPELTKRSLGRQWDKLEAAQQEEFSSLLREMIEASYRSKLKLAAKGDVKKPAKVEIEWLEEKIEEDEATVTARVGADKTVAILEFKLSWHGGRWHVFDLAIDDVSTVRTYRSQFRKLIEKEGFPELLSRMRNKIADIREGRADLGP